jgi:hypothetical protein
MENKKIKLFLMIFLIITVFQSVTGFVTLYAGIYAKEFDKKKADEMLVIIKQNDKNYYDKIFDPEDNTYLQDFKNNYTKKGNSTAVVAGIILIVFSIFYSVPILMLTLNKKEENLLEETVEDNQEQTF